MSILGTDPFQQAQGAFRKFVLDHSLNILDAARLMGMLEVTRADALIEPIVLPGEEPHYEPITAGEHIRAKAGRAIHA